MTMIRNALMTLFMLPGLTAAAADPGVVGMEFLNGDNPPTPECHASTLEETPGGLVAAWFGGLFEKSPDVGIWVVRHDGSAWTEPVEVANGVQYTRPDGSVHRQPTWNPVLFQYPDGPLVLFYKCGPSPSTWWGMMMVSDDGGITWTDPHRLPEHIDGPVRNKPILLGDGNLLCGSSTEFDGWRVHFEWTPDRGRSWQRIPAINDGKQAGAIQPTLLRHPDGRIQALCRNQDGNGRVLSTVSRDGGVTWSQLTETSLPNPNSAIDAVTLHDGRFLLVYNHTHRRGTTPQGREMMNVAISEDGTNWQAVAVLDNESRSEFSYPAVIQSQDGMVHVTWTWKRRLVRHATIDPSEIQPRPVEGMDWPF